MRHNGYFSVQLKGRSLCSQSKLLPCSTVLTATIKHQQRGFFFSLSKATLKLDLLSWKSEVKVPVVERKLIWGCISGHAVIQFSFQRYFHRRKFLRKISGSLIVNCSGFFQRACMFLLKQDLECSLAWCRCVCRSVREHLDSSKKKPPVSTTVPRGYTQVLQKVLRNT